MKKIFSALFAITIVSATNAFADVKTSQLKAPADTTIQESKAGKSDRNMMLNANDANVPREINVGLPESGNGAIVYVNGAKHALGIPKSFYHWAGGNAFEKVGSVSLMEAAVSTGVIGVVIDSYTRFGGDKQSGIFTLGTSTNGLLKADMSLSGPISKSHGWYYSLGLYSNYDPTNVNAPGRTFVTEQQNYNLAISKRWGEKASLNLIYQFSFGRSNFGNGYSFAPFIYNGDGSLSRYNGFRIGRDCYFPSDDYVEWMDLKTGESRSGNIGKLEDRKIHDISLYAKFNTESGWKLSAIAHSCLLPSGTTLKHALSGIDNVSGDAVQSRLLTLYDSKSTDVELNVKAEKRMGRHHLKLGSYAIYIKQYEAGSSFRYAHTVGADPERTTKNGAMSWDFNKNSSYMDALQSGLIVYGFDEWNPVDRLRLRFGLRAKFANNGVYTAARLAEDEGTTINKRVNGFNLADESLSKIHHIKKNGLDYAASTHVSYRLAGRLFCVAEGFYSITNKSVTYYKNATVPTVLPIGNAFARAGLMFDNEWMDCTAMFSYITSWNNAAAVDVTKVIGGKSETQLYTAQYGIGTPGLTLDANFHRGGFNMHTLATWQTPRYNNYDCHFEFSDGSTQDISYTGNYVSGISRWMFELDPSYKWDNVRLWMSIRYFSRQYACRSNKAWFNGRWESFMGVDYNITKQHKVSLDVVNLLFQNGAKGSMDIADTIDDEAALQGMLLAGTYMRPFCINFSYTFRF